MDEIQNVTGFEKWLFKEYELNTSRLFVTGSNAKLLSREIGTALSGRYPDVTVFPLSFKEHIQLKGIPIESGLDLISHRLEINREFNKYLTHGGFPKVALTEDQDLKKAELKMYFDSILFRDIVARYSLKNVEALMALSVYLLSITGKLLSINALKNRLKLSFDLINRYVEYLESAYLIFRVPLFDWSLKKQQVNPRKVYAVDMGLSNIVSFQGGRRFGNQIENLVFLELLRRGKEVYYYKTRQDLEVDFIIMEDNSITRMIQVSANIDDEKTKKREIRALVKASSEIPHADKAELIVLVPDRNEIIKWKGKEVLIKDLKEWLLI